jgi:CRISPR-associated protein Cas5h
MNASSSKRILVFDAKGAFAHFKRFYTTASPTSYAIPPRTALQGLIAAVLGMDRQTYPVALASLEVGVQLLEPIKRIRIGTNWINTKGNHWQPIKDGKHYPRTPTRIEFLKDVAYRVYVHLSDTALQAKLEELIANKQSVFTPCLGISECIAMLEFVRVTTVVAITAGENTGHISAVPSDLLVQGGLDITLNPEAQLFKERLPSQMDAGRVVSMYREVIFEALGKPIHLRSHGAAILETGETIAFL